MRRNNAWKPPDYRSAVRDGKQPDGSGTRRVSQGQGAENGGEVATSELVHQLVREDRVKTASEKQKMFRNTMQLIERRKTGVKGNIVTFTFNERSGFIDKLGVMNNVLLVGGFVPANVVSIKINDFRSNECEVLFKDDVKVDCENVEDKLKKKGFNVTVGNFIETEEICMIYGLPPTSDVEGLKEQIQDSISPFVRRIVSITATTHYGKNENDFFHGRTTGDYKVKVVPFHDKQIPNYVAIGEEKKMARVHYVRKMTEKKVMCDVCFSTEHMMRDPNCPGVVVWTDYVTKFDEARDLALREFEASSSCPVPAPSFVSKNAKIKELTEEVVDLQAKNAELQAEKIEMSNRMDEMMTSLRLANGESISMLSESSFSSAGAGEDIDAASVDMEDPLKTADKDVIVNGVKRRASDVSKLSDLKKGDAIWWKTSKQEDFIGVFLMIVDPTGIVRVQVENNKNGKKPKKDVNLSKCQWGTMSN